MRSGWHEVGTLEELNAFLRVVGGFHDGVIKEVHWVNGDYVADNLSMLPYRYATVRMLVQRQWKDPSAVEIVFDTVARIHLDWDFIFDSAAVSEAAPRGFVGDTETLLVLKMEQSEIAFVKMRWRDASDWMGPDQRFVSDSITGP